MRSARFPALMVVLSAVLFCLLHSSAQNAALQQADPNPDPQPCREAPGLSAPKARPFSAKYEERTVRSLADGSTLTMEYRGVISRDSEGRMYSAGSFITPHEKDKVVPEVVIVRISDPTKEMLLSWTTGQGTKIVQRMHVAGASLEPPLLPDSTLPRLGGRIINDIYAVGYRVSGTTPAGQEGNSHALAHSSEWWCAPDLQVNVQSTDDSLVNGRKTINLTEIQRNEPDPSLFKIPDGYTVKDIHLE